MTTPRTLRPESVQRDAGQDKNINPGLLHRRGCFSRLAITRLAR